MLYAPFHAAYEVEKWLEEQACIIVAKWTPSSPDFNPIEHLWFLFKEGVYSINLDIESVCGDDETIQEELSKVLFRSWEAIQDSYLDNLVEFMKRRVEAIIAAGVIVCMQVWGGKHRGDVQLNEVIR